MSPANQESARDLQLAFDVGHSFIGAAVLKAPGGQLVSLHACGTVIFPADDCLASERRSFRRQRRHIRATRLRIARMKRLPAHLGLLTQEQLDAPGCAWPWLLAARVLRGGSKLTWGELWDVLRWYAHNRGYDGNKGRSRHHEAANAEDTEKEQKAHELLDAFAAKHGRAATMAEIFCKNRRRVRMVAPHELPSHDAASEKALRLVIERLGDFLANAAPRFRAAVDRLGHDHLLDHRQIRRPAWPTISRR